MLLAFRFGVGGYTSIPIFVWDSHPILPITVVDGRRLSLTNLDKVLYPPTGTTKGEAIHYWATAAEVILPHLSDRPLSFLRFPDGPDGLALLRQECSPRDPRLGDYLPGAPRVGGDHPAGSCCRISPHWSGRRTWWSSCTPPQWT